MKAEPSPTEKGTAIPGLLGFVPPEAEERVLFVCALNRDCFVRHIEGVRASSGVDVVVIEHSTWLHSAVECNLIPVSAQKEPLAATDMLNRSASEHGGMAWRDSPGTINPSAVALLINLLMLCNLAEDTHARRDNLSHRTVAQHHMA